MKTKEELNALKVELSDEELAKVAGGTLHEENGIMYFIVFRGQCFELNGLHICVRYDYKFPANEPEGILVLAQRNGKADSTTCVMSNDPIFEHYAGIDSSISQQIL